MVKKTKNNKVVSLLESPFVKMETILLGVVVLVTTPLWLFKSINLDYNILLVIVLPFGFATWANWHFFGKKV